MRRVREYRYIVREMMQADLERHDGIDELAFFASSYGSIKESLPISCWPIWTKVRGMARYGPT